jgi:N-acetylglucosamine-6-phosphate deacetylase
MAFSGCTLAQAICCATENIVDMMGDRTRGKLEEGRRADFLVLNDAGEVLQTWIGGVKVWEKRD